jgi:hypothetical protein
MDFLHFPFGNETASSHQMFSKRIHGNGEDAVGMEHFLVTFSDIGEK